ncbi:MAG: hypothetical protein RR471_12090, partial [Bacteroides sp.]
QNLKQYRGKFPLPKEKINKSYGCRSIYQPKDTDSVAVSLPDSLTDTEEDIDISQIIKETN